MIIQCKNCSKTFEVHDSAIPSKGRKVQCGNCGTKWTQIPIKKERKNKPIKIKKEDKKENIENTEDKKESIENTEYKKEINPSSTLPVKKVKRKIKKEEFKDSGLGFFGYIVVLLILFITIIGVLETFKESISHYWPSINDQLGFIYESLNNIIIIIKELFNRY